MYDLRKKGWLWSHERVCYTRKDSRATLRFDPSEDGNDWCAAVNGIETPSTREPDIAVRILMRMVDAEAYLLSKESADLVTSLSPDDESEGFSG